MDGSGQSRPVVVGVDDEDTAQPALVWAADEAERRGVQLRLAHATAPNHHRSHRAGGSGSRKAGRRVLEEAAALVSDGHPGIDLTTVLAEGPPAQVLCHESHDACLVVLGSRRLSRLEEFLGTHSVAVPVSARAACPVVVVLEPGDSTERPPYLVAGVDGSPASRAALAYAFAAAAARGADLRTLWVWQPSLLESTDEVVVLQKCRRLLHETVAEQAEDYPDTTVTRQVVRGHPVEELAEAAERACALVVGRRGRGGFTGMRLGSVPHGLLHRAHCPVTVVPAPDTD
ncbi:universal stress protein [Kitasatospora sp. DSM 101779]|uniref:universal stress protein n=1 Tax=Kitasatospora sp. DSM 101779 TaxID=2853165 RepID=UPI0021D81453|nr:universal stress protein [Kitasatospora sp. DSM 101779]MCU7826445.1 universal stress protein [Kitasatospora sp. DSM 101779]